jgi:DNA-directed RNA polymerase specialized sigma24 family protein
MKIMSDHRSDPPQVGVAVLPPTRWSAVARAGGRQHDAWISDLDTLARLYRPVLVRHVVVHLRVPSDQAEDLVQSFLVEKVLDENVLRHASPERGRLRAFMLKVFSNFVRSRLREQQARKRRPTSPDAERLEDLPELLSPEAAPGASFDTRWACHVLSRTLERMRVECQCNGRQVLWDLLEARTFAPVFEGAAPLPYEELVVRFGLRSPSEASNLLVTAKRMFARLLREIVRETVSRDALVDEEMMELKRVLAR